MTQSEQICHGGSRSAEGGHYQAALVQFSQALAAVDREHKTDSRRKPDRYRINKAYVYQNRGYVYLQLHDYGRGIADLTEAIKLRPTYKTNYLNRARAYDLTGQKAAADADRAKAASLPADRDDDVPKSRVDVGQALEGADFVLGGGDKKKH
jgi:tetratricopeptide (TPR) repeat protein